MPSLVPHGVLGASQACCSFRRLGLGLLLGVLVFCLHQVVLWDVWACEECSAHRGCTEVIYEFERQAWDSGVHRDQQLITQCRNQSGPIADPNKWRTSQPPQLLTKCGNVQPSPLSLTHSQPSAPLQASRVPNIVHYISLGSRQFTFLNYLSFLSVQKFLAPRFIFLHGNGVPYGPWWERTVREVRNIYRVPREQPTRIQGYRVQWVEHSSDVLRLQTLWDNGGIYLDTDILVLKPFAPLMQYSTVLGRETYYGLGSGIILAEPRAPFICLWRQGFRNYQPWPWHWAKYAVWNPHKIAKALPDLIHVEESTFHIPNFEHTDDMFYKTIDWSNSYAMHIWKRHFPVPNTPEGMMRINNTLGEVMRHVYYA